VNADGTSATPLLERQALFLIRGILPDGRLFLHMVEKDNDLYLMNADGSNLTALTNDDDLFEGGVFYSPLSNRFMFFHGNRMYLIDDTGAIVWEYEFDCGKTNCYAPSWAAWSPDGIEVAFRIHENGTYTLLADGSQPVPTAIELNDGPEISYSPDGRYLAYGLYDQNGDFIRILDRTTHTISNIVLPLEDLEMAEWRPLP
jgi:Tol biopolymer transport system component